MAHTAAQAGHGGSALARAIPVIVGLSFLGLLILVIGDIAGAQGTREGEEGGSPFFDAAWLCFSLGAIIALVAGVVALLRGRSRRRADEVRAGKLGVGYFVAALVVTALTASLT